MHLLRRFFVKLIQCYILNTSWQYTLATNIDTLQKCSDITKYNNEPCIYDGPEAKVLLPLISQSSTSASFNRNNDGFNHADYIKEAHNENWKNVEKGHIHYLHRAEGPFGSLGLDNGKSQIPTHSSSCRTDNAVTTDKHHTGSQNPTILVPIASHVIKKCISVSHLRHVQYVTSIGVGTPPQTIRPLVDTGSTNTWVVSTECTADTCSAVNRFSPSKSRTFMDFPGNNTIRIKFGTGTIIGKPAVDSFTIQNTTVEKQTFGLVRNEVSDNHYNVFEMLKFEGIFGLGFPKMAWNNHTPLLDNYSKYISADLSFSLYFSNDNKYSALLIGGVDKRFYAGKLIMLPLIREFYWEVKLLELWVGADKLCCDEESYVIFDSGTSFNTLPHDTFVKFKELVPPQLCDQDNFESLVKDLPDIKYVLTGGVTIIIKPEQYLFISKDHCKPAYMQINVPSQYGQAYILGTSAFMQHYYTVYQRGTKSLPSMFGFAPAVHTRDNQDYISKFTSDQY